MNDFNRYNNTITTNNFNHSLRKIMKNAISEDALPNLDLYSLNVACTYTSYFALTIT